MRLEGKVAMVTGAASGIGRATSLTLAREGAAVMCADINTEGAQETADAIAADGGTAASVELNVTDEEAVQAALAATVEQLGALHILVNDAGISGRMHEYHDVIDVNLNGVYYCMKYGAALIEEHGGGSIVSLSSIMGLVGGSAPGYTASKHGVLGLTRNYALMYGGRGVRVNCVNPGYIETPMTEFMLSDEARREDAVGLHPIGRLGRPEDVANAILFLASEDASFVTGVALPVDGGYTAQ
ncbi:MAG: SDR family oxidoreductase [Chloroflexi bacterium]|nr:SDR family oxidoreductase [Chloroflexota bacterium]